MVMTFVSVFFQVNSGRLMPGKLFAEIGEGQRLLGEELNRIFQSWILGRIFLKLLHYGRVAAKYVICTKRFYLNTCYYNFF